MILIQKDFPPELARRWRKVMREDKPTVSDNFERWKLSQERDRWLYNVIGGVVLCLLVFVVAGGCK